MIGQYLTELKQIYHGNKKRLIYATKHLFVISYVYFLMTCMISAQGIIGCHVSLPLRTVLRKFKLIEKIVCEDEDFWMSGYQ